MPMQCLAQSSVHCSVAKKTPAAFTTKALSEPQQPITVIYKMEPLGDIQVQDLATWGSSVALATLRTGLFALNQDSMDL